jgi:hypothetical protein
MKELIIKKTPNTPNVNLNPETGVMKIEGRSIPENPGDFFDPIIEWLEEYFQHPIDVTSFEMNLEYDDGKSCLINWYYEEDDEAIFSLGEHYRNTIKIPFKLIEFI